MKGSTFDRCSATRAANRWMSFTRLRQAKWITSTMFLAVRTMAGTSSSNTCSAGVRITVCMRILSAVQVNIGDQVSQGEPIAVMGHTGEGIDRERSHVHLELNLLLNGDFGRWSNKYFPKDENRHGIYNGHNLDGIDIARLYLELSKNPQKTIPEFLQEETIWWRAVVPASPRMDLLQRYPWLSGGQTAARRGKSRLIKPASRFILRPRAQTIEKPVLTWVKFSPYPYALQTRGYIQGSGSNYSLSKDGEQYLDLISPKGEGAAERVGVSA